MHSRAFLARVVPSSAQSSVQAFNPDCTDFSLYVARRLGVEAQVANEVLGYWLSKYEGEESSKSAIWPATLAANDPTARGEDRHVSGL
jgi:hypothetical protein